MIDPPRLTAARSRKWTVLRNSGLLLALAYGLAWTGLVAVSHLLWFLPAGLRLGGCGHALPGDERLPVGHLCPGGARGARPRGAGAN